MTKIKLPPIRSTGGKHSSFTDDELRARDLQIAAAVLEAAADFCTDDYHTSNGWGITTADRRCAYGIRALQVEHDETT